MKKAKKASPRSTSMRKPNMLQNLQKYLKTTTFPLRKEPVKGKSLTLEIHNYCSKFIELLNRGIVHL